METIRTIDSHSEGEPTRVVIEGAPDLGHGSACERMEVMRSRFDGFRSTVVNEPRGSNVLVGALLLEAVSDSAVAQVIFFNNVGYLGMCGHGTMGVAATLAHLGRIDVGDWTLETPVGDVRFSLAEDGLISVENVYSYRLAADVVVKTKRFGVVKGDIAWGGNWFFLVGEHGQVLTEDRIQELTECTWEIRRALHAAGITGSDGAEIDHVELFGPPVRGDADSRNFVLCPGGEYDRSPCGTGTSAKMACLSADGRLDEDSIWRQESVIGSLFSGRIRKEGDGVIPTVSGRAWITAEARLILDPTDPYRQGIRL